jgi:hypothetical protein
MQQEPICKWEVKDGVINLIPAHERDEFLEKLLATPVHRFAPKKGISKFEIRNAIVSLDEVRKLLESHKMKLDKHDYKSDRSIYSDDNVDLSISDTNVRGVLNKVIRESEHKLWVVSRVADEKNVFYLGF